MIRHGKLKNSIGKQHYRKLPLSADRWQLVVDVVEGRSLAPKDKNGLSDPFVIISLGDEQYTSHFAPETLTPKWREPITFEVFDLASSLHVSVWDKDKLGKDYMGGVDVILQMCTKPVDQWFELKDLTNNKEYVSGDVHLRLHLREKHSPAVTLDLESKRIDEFLNEETKEVAFISDYLEALGSQNTVQAQDMKKQLDLAQQRLQVLKKKRTELDAAKGKCGDIDARWKELTDKLHKLIETIAYNEVYKSTFADKNFHKELEHNKELHAHLQEERDHLERDLFQLND